jgi:hypothetical protein
MAVSYWATNGWAAIRTLPKFRAKFIDGEASERGDALGDVESDMDLVVSSRKTLLRRCVNTFVLHLCRAIRSIAAVWMKLHCATCATRALSCFILSVFVRARTTNAVSRIHTFAVSIVKRRDKK